MDSSFTYIGHSFLCILGHLLSTPLLLLLLAATEIRVDHLTRSLQVKSTQTSNGNLYNHLPPVILWLVFVVSFVPLLCY